MQYLILHTYCWNRPNNLLQKNIARIMHYLILHTYCWNREQFIAEKKIAKKLYNMSLVHTA